MLVENDQNQKILPSAVDYGDYATISLQPVSFQRQKNEKTPKQ